MTAELLRLQQAMTAHGLNGFVVTCGDFHLNEFVADHARAVHYLCGFTGYEATLVVTPTDATIFVDSRYTSQVMRELAGTGIAMGDDLDGYLLEILPQKGILAFDGRCISTVQAMDWQRLLAGKGCTVQSVDLMSDIWINRPALPMEPAFTVPVYGESSQEKLAQVYAAMEKVGADCHLMCTSEAICWMLNLRGSDIACMHLVHSFALLNHAGIHLFAAPSKFSPELLAAFIPLHITLHPYSDFAAALPALTRGRTVLLDSQRVSWDLYQQVQGTVIDGVDPACTLKQIKHPTELEYLRDAQMQDSAAVTRLMRWLKTNECAKTESSVMAELLRFRQQEAGFIDNSFSPVSAYGAGAAEVFYSPSQEVELHQQGMLLLDSGGNYDGGSTDITRTFILGDITEQMRIHYTLTLAALSTLSATQFPKGVKGCHLDVIARAELWKVGMDYSTRTGHGLGFLLNIHETPVDFTWKRPSNTAPALEAGMVMTIEPGAYVAGEYGIRLENDVVVRQGLATPYGQFMEFETLSFVPFDLDGVDPALLTPRQRQWLNDYHQQVYTHLAPRFDQDEKTWLAHATRAI